MYYFGKRYPAPFYETAKVCPTPVDFLCTHCNEAIATHDSGYVFFTLHGRTVLHRECFNRGVLGSVAHQMRRCSCFVTGSTCGDDPALTRRQAALAAMTVFDTGGENEVP